MRSIKALALVLAFAALAGLVLAATTTAAAGKGPQSNTNSNSGTRPPNQDSSSDGDSSRRDEDGRQDNQSTHDALDDGPRRPAPARSRRPGASRYRFEVGVMPRYITNYFQAQEFNAGATVTPARNVYVTTLSGSF